MMAGAVIGAQVEFMGKTGLFCCAACPENTEDDVPVSLFPPVPSAMLPTGPEIARSVAIGPGTSHEPALGKPRQGGQGFHFSARTAFSTFISASDRWVAFMSWLSYEAWSSVSARASLLNPVPKDHNSCTCS